MKLKVIDFSTFLSLEMLPMETQFELIYHDIDKLWYSLDFVKELPTIKQHLPKLHPDIQSYCQNYTDDAAADSLINFVKKYKAKKN